MRKICMKNTLLKCLLLVASPLSIAGSDFGNIDVNLNPQEELVQATPFVNAQPIASYDKVWLQGGVKGQSVPIPLVEALRALVPDALDILIDSDVNASSMVKWSSGTITSALKEILTQSEAKYRMNQGTMLVETLSFSDKKPQQRLAWPRFMPSIEEPVAMKAVAKPLLVSARPKEKISRAPIVDAPVVSNIQTKIENKTPIVANTVAIAQPTRIIGNAWWTITSGQPLAAALAQWGRQSQVNIAWEGSDIPSSDSIRIYGSFDSALNHVIESINKDAQKVTVNDNHANVGRVIRIVENQKGNI